MLEGGDPTRPDEAQVLILHMPVASETDEAPSQPLIVQTGPVFEWIALVLGRFPLPAGDSAGYNSIARNLVAIAIHLVIAVLVVAVAASEPLCVVIARSAQRAFLVREGHLEVGQHDRHSPCSPGSACSGPRPCHI